MQAIILAAGEGRRLRDHRGRPKCLREVGGLTLLEHQLRALAWAGVGDVSIVVGYQHEQIRSVAGSAARYVVNHRFAETNSMYSFLLARPVINDDVIVMNSDLFFHPGLVLRLVEAGEDALLYDSGSGEEDEQMKIHMEGDKLVEMSKVMGSDRVDGENLGMVHLTEPTARDAIMAADTLAAEGHDQAWLATAINAIAPAHPIRCLDVAGSPWVEIDFPEDLERARVEILPAVAAIDVCAAALPLGLAALSGVS